MKPPDTEVQALSAGWLAKAEVDLRACDGLSAPGIELWEAVAFHSQQAVEKALKALLVWHQVEFPKTHDIQRLLELLAGTEPELAGASVGAAELTPYGVEYRYPGEYPPVDRDSATAALLVARKACHEVARRIRTG